MATLNPVPPDFIPKARVLLAYNLSQKWLWSKMNDPDPERRLRAYRLRDGRKLYFKAQDLERLFTPATPTPRELRRPRGRAKSAPRS